MVETLGNMERRIDNALFRCMFASSIFQARKMISNGQVLVNGELTRKPSHTLQDGDMLQILPAIAPRVYRLTNHPMIRLWAFVPQYLEVNYSTLSAIFLRFEIGGIYQILHEFGKFSR